LTGAEYAKDTPAQPPRADFARLWVAVVKQRVGAMLGADSLAISSGVLTVSSDSGEICL
jgi:hypothetical protein